MELEVIKTKDQHEKYLAEIEKLMDIEPAPESVEGKRLELFAVLIEKYESEHYHFGKPDPIEAIKIRMEDLDLKQKDLVAYIGSPSKVSEVLSENRSLSLQMIRALSKGLGIPTDVLVQETKNSDGFNPQVQQLDDAKRILKILEEDIYRAIWYASFYERVTLEGNADDVCEAFGESDEAWGIEICQNALCDALMLAIFRIIWGTKENTASLEALCGILKKREVTKLFAISDKAKLKDLVKTVEKDILANHQCASVKKYRNTRLAHLGVESDPKKHKGQRGAEYGDAPDILNKLNGIVDGFLMVLEKDRPKETPSRFESFGGKARKIANKFWKYAAHIEQN